MKKIYLIVGAILWGGIVDAQTLSVEQYRQKVLEYNQDIQKSQQAVNGALYSLIGIVSGNIQFRKKARFNSFQGI